MQTARALAGASGADTYGNAHPVYNTRTARHQLKRSQSLPPPAPDSISSIVEAGLAEIEIARAAARTAVADEVRAFHRRLAEDLANHLADNVLKMRHVAPGYRRGRRVPPSVTEIRTLLAVYKMKIEAEREWWPWK